MDPEKGTMIHAPLFDTLPLYITSKISMFPVWAMRMETIGAPPKSFFILSLKGLKSDNPFNFGMMKADAVYYFNDPKPE